MRTTEKLTLENLGKGAASEMFQKELENVIQNILDPNTKAEAKRTVTLKMTITPGKKDRSLCVVEVACDCKIAAVKPFETAIFVGMDQGVASAAEYAPQQGELFGSEEKPAGRLIAMGGNK